MLVWANDDKVVVDHDFHRIFPRRSQFGRISLLGDPSLWDGDQGYVHFLSFKSGLIKRTCRSTFRAETHAMLYATEASDSLRAVVSSLKGQFQRKDWEPLVQQQMHSVWFTDCQSLHDYLVNPIAAGC